MADTIMEDITMAVTIMEDIIMEVTIMDIIMVVITMDMEAQMEGSIMGLVLLQLAGEQSAWVHLDRIISNKDPLPMVLLQAVIIVDLMEH